jgi:hypothetical protein
MFKNIKIKLIPMSESESELESPYEQPPGPLPPAPVRTSSPVAISWMISNSK